MPHVVQPPELLKQRTDMTDKRTSLPVADEKRVTRGARRACVGVTFPTHRRRTDDGRGGPRARRRTARNGLKHERGVAGPGGVRLVRRERSSAARYDIEVKHGGSSTSRQAP